MTREDRYLVVHQTRDHDPTDYENLLADGVERAYAKGIHDLEALVKELTEACVPAPGGKPWTQDMFTSEMKRLGA